eukprot:GEZU01029291.1.p1 GENE.GEZU01029291.1~~GEZU01029291.1.p1  ORF type:complete len:188 (-),score=92.04 GEZU01029291.1:245-808(-)
MFTALRKIKKSKGQKPDQIETQVAQALFDIEVHSKELRPELQALYFVAAKEVEVKADKKAIVIFVPVKQLADYHRIQIRLVRELEKKFSGKHVIILAQRKTMRKPKSMKIHRPIARTRAVVEENLMADLVYPIDITGKRTRVKLDGSIHYKTFLDPKEKGSYENKLNTFSVIYKKLTGKNVKFEWAQ